MNALLPGNVYIFQPNLALTGGGSQSFHEMHHELLEQGFSSKMFRVHPRYATARSVNASEEEVARLCSEGLGPHDTMLVPELAEFSAPHMSSDDVSSPCSLSP